MTEPFRRLRAFAAAALFSFAVATVADASPPKEATPFPSLGEKVMFGDAALARDGTAIAASGHWAYEEPHTAPLGVWSAPSGKLLWKRSLRSGNFGAVALRADGKRLACASENAVHVYDVAGRRLLRRIDCGAPVGGVAFVGAGGHLLTVSGGGIFRRWDAETGAVLRRWGGGGSGIARFTLSHDGERMAYALPARGAVGPRVLVADTYTGAVRAGAPGLRDPVVFTRDGAQFFAAIADVRADGGATADTAIVALYDLKGRAVTRRFPGSTAQPGFGPSRLALSPDGGTLVACLGGGGDYTETRVYDVTTGRSRPVDGLVGDVGLAFSPDGTSLYAADWGGELCRMPLSALRRGLDPITTATTTAPQKSSRSAEKVPLAESFTLTRAVAAGKLNILLGAPNFSPVQPLSQSEMVGLVYYACQGLLLPEYVRYGQDAPQPRPVAHHYMSFAEAKTFIRGLLSRELHHWQHGSISRGNMQWVENTGNMMYRPPYVVIREFRTPSPRSVSVRFDVDYVAGNIAGNPPVERLGTGTARFARTANGWVVTHFDVRKRQR